MLTSPVPGHVPINSLPPPTAAPAGATPVHTRSTSRDLLPRFRRTLLRDLVVVALVVVFVGLLAAGSTLLIP